MRHTLQTIATVVTLTAQAAGALACQPCESSWDFEQTLKQADVVVVGRRAENDPSRRAAANPDTVVVQVLRTLRGDVGNQAIRVRNVDGACPLEVATTDQPHVLLLSRAGEKFAAINGGCAVRALPVKDDMVELEGMWVPLQSFEAMVTLYYPEQAAQAAREGV